METSLAETAAPQNPQISSSEAQRQAEAWLALAGNWKSNLSLQEEIAALYKARDRPRKL